MKREQGGWCNLFRDKDSKKKEQGIFTERPIKNLWKLFYYGKKQKHFLVCQQFQIFSPRNGAIHSSKVELFCLFFGRIEGIKKTFRNQLTFMHRFGRFLSVLSMLCLCFPGLGKNVAYLTLDIQVELSAQA